MAKITFIEPAGTQRTVDIPAGWSLMEGAVKHGVEGIAAECGGGCACATCHVFVAAEWAGRLPAIAPMENDLLECTAVARAPESRLSCQVQVTDALDGLTVTVPDRQS